MRRDEEPSPDEPDVSESVTISLLISAAATVLVYFGLWGGSVPAITRTAAALAVAVGLPAGVLFYYRGTRSTRLDDLPPLAVLIAVGIPLYILFPERLPPFVALAIVVAVWTDTAIRAAVKYV
ncbi:hypothetical protein B4589_003350 [Halolamina sp. CBA1230]|uniref:hypothetical protein n=1 Tax=Halolamina sp. CBA1230 TaxID=1853690 RepID=UPI0009A1D577|nr:hypothetical protein [Halolamina sp. CBA1230]QKY19460.1 hypothetical protein B4589_003350 [Halolamina sp. CBA1230]